MKVIQMEDVTKDYGNGKGIFNISLDIEEGEMFGYVGTNGAGKTTTLRSILGFIKPENGKVRVNGIDPWDNGEKLMREIGYIPGEIAFPDLRSGEEVLRSQAEFLGIKDLSRANDLIERLQLDIRGNPRRFSKGMKQKLAIVMALMHDPKILLFDEPTTGLDPLMRDSFMQIVKEEHGKGKTIIMSSHMFDELEEYSDRVGLIVNGKIIDIADMDEIRNTSFRIYKVEFKKEEEFKKFLCNSKANIIREQTQYNQVTVRIDMNDLSSFMKEVGTYDIRYIREVKYNLESYFEEHLGLFEEKAGNGNVDKQTII